MTTCQYFRDCNGCSTQHIPYELQLQNKRKALAGLLRRDDIKVFSANEKGYRNRIEFIFNSRGPAFRGRDKLINIKRCDICDERLNILLGELISHFSSVDNFDFRKRSGTFCYAVVRAGQETSVSFVLNRESSRLDDAIERVKAFSEKTSAGSVIITYTSPDEPDSISDDYFVLKGTDLLEEKMMGYSFRYVVQGFFQNNTKVAELMHEHCNSLLKRFEGKGFHLLDLYAGVGTFGILNSRFFKDVMIVESFAGIIASADENIKNNNVRNAKTIVQDARRLRSIKLESPLVVVMDPPRKGMHPETIAQLKKLKPESMLYVSCNPLQMSRDIKKFSGYEIGTVALFDMFPQTNHIEAVIELVWKNHYKSPGE